MWDKLKTYINYCANIGITEDLPYFEKVKIRILNQSNWIAMSAAIVLLLQSRYLNRGDIWLDFIFLTIFPAPLIFNALRNYLAARLIATVIFPIFILGLAIVYGSKSSIDFVYFAIILVVLIFYESRWARILNITGIVIIFIFNFLYWQKHPGLYALQPTLLNDGIIFSSVTLLIAIIIHYFFNEHKRNYHQQLVYNKTLADRNEKLEHYIEQNEAKKQLIQIVAHDLKSPAASFLNLTQKMSYLLRQEEPQRIIEMADHIEKSGTNFFYTLDNLLNWVISQQEGLKVANDFFPLIPLIEEIKLDMAFLSNPKTFLIVSPIDEESMVYSDRNMIKIILSNILHNAIKVSPPNEKIIITFESGDIFDEIKITDFGIGMSKQVKDQLNQPEVFYTSSGTQKEQGYGLGLKICYRLVIFLNGKILFKSRPGEGCQFTIRIPNEKMPRNSSSSSSTKKAEPKSDR